MRPVGVVAGARPDDGIRLAKAEFMEARPTEGTQAGASGGPLRVLVVDDELDCRETLQSAIVALGHACSVARDGAEAWEMYETSRPDVILSDWKMPRMDGVHLCQKIRAEDSARSYTHFIFVTGNNDKAHFIHGMRAGADDYIAKPVDLDELEARLAVAGRIVALHGELRERNSSLRHDSERANVAARSDPLTKAFNRLALQEDLEALASRAWRYGHGYCAALCDIDQFKAYNDYFGHLPGDEVLRQVSQSIQSALRRGDVFYRYGGEEFLVILPEQSLVEASLVMDRVREGVEHLAVRHAPSAGRPFVTISVGICLLGAAPQESIDGWLQRTDAALYVAKARGRNCVALGGLP
jgi:two-component system cell cycle response regulator